MVEGPEHPSPDLPPEMATLVTKLLHMTFKDVKEEKLLKKLGGEPQDAKAAIRYCVDDKSIFCEEKDDRERTKQSGRVSKGDTEGSDVAATARSQESKSDKDAQQEHVPANGVQSPKSDPPATKVDAPSAMLPEAPSFASKITELMRQAENISSQDVTLITPTDEITGQVMRLVQVLQELEQRLRPLMPERTGAMHAAA
jgi:hypothetical protein